MPKQTPIQAVPTIKPHAQNITQKPAIPTVPGIPNAPKVPAINVSIPKPPPIAPMAPGIPVIKNFINFFLLKFNYKECRKHCKA